MLGERVRKSVDHRLKAALSAYYYGNQKPWQRWIRQRRFRNSMQALPTTAPELAQMLRSAMELTKRDPNRPNSRHSDALFLLDMITRLKPSRVLECGSGLSTLIIAYALDQLERTCGHTSQFVSLDESEEYLDKLVRPTLPQHLARRITLQASPIGYWRFTNTRTGTTAHGIGYQDVPPVDFDFVYVDGPQVRQGQYQGLVRHADVGGVPSFLDRKPFDCDALNVLIERRRPITIAIDQRIDTRWQLKSVLDRPFKAAYHYAARKSVFELPPEAARCIRRSRLDALQPLGPNDDSVSAPSIA